MKIVLPVWVMRVIKPCKLRKLEVFNNMTISNTHLASYNMTISNTRLASFFSIWSTPNLTHLSFIGYFFENNEVDLATMPNLIHLVFRDCYNMLYELTVNPETKLKSLELYNTNSNIRDSFNDSNWHNHYPESFFYLLNKFKDLETIIIKVAINEFTFPGRESLANAIQRHKKTLTILILQYRQRSFSMGLICHTYLINAIKTCKKLSQLCFEVEFEYFLVKINELIECLPDLTLLYLVSLNMPDCRPPPVVEDIDSIATNLLETVPTSSKLSLLCFRTRGAYDNEMDNHKDDYVECFFRSRVHVHETSGSERVGPVTTITTQQALYLVRKSSIIRKLEPWLFQQQEPSRWFEELKKKKAGILPLGVIEYIHYSVSFLIGI